MGLPGQRRSSSSKRRRAAHFALKAQALAACAKCKKLNPPHTACRFCGTYRGRTIIVTAAAKRLKRTQRRQRKQSAPAA